MSHAGAAGRRSRATGDPYPRDFHNAMSRNNSSSSGGAGTPGSPRGATPRAGHQQLRDRVSFFEQFSTTAHQNRSSSCEDLVDDAGHLVVRRSSSRASNSSFEESFERLVEEGEYNGSKVVKFEKITVTKSVREVSASALRCAIIVCFVMGFLLPSRD